MVYFNKSRSFTFSPTPRKFHTDSQSSARTVSHLLPSSRRRLPPWHTAPNSHYNGGLKNVIDSVNVSLGAALDGFGPDLRNIINFWVPDAEFESCYLRDQGALALSLPVRLSSNTLRHERMHRRFIVRYLHERFNGTGFLQNAKEIHRPTLVSV